MTIPIPAEDPRHVPNRAVIDPSAITQNTRALTGLLEEHTALMAVVKADGYGHGMLTAARAALEGGATWLGVAHPASALALSRAGLDVNILTWLYEPHTAETVLPEVISSGINVSVGSSAMLELVSAAARQADRRARVHLKIDTGMGRNGVLPEQVREIGAAMREDDFIEIAAAWTHLTDADDPSDPSTDQEVARFDSACEALEEEVGPIPLQHLANSAALLTRPDLHRDLVRPGIALYGYPPVPTDVPLRPAMTLTSRLALVKEVPEGTTIGYGRIRTTDRRTRLGLVPIGYADGLHRVASDRCEVLVRTASADSRALQVGRISMDQIVIDLGPDSDACAGDEVFLFGDAEGAPTGPAATTADDWARAAGTIPYEILTSVAGRVSREVRA
ncbi:MULTISPECIES: alanine racemase [Brachybacterium]|uniref:Alanine racemase n=1 Tax=Brachybacterium alimentarium TaxID=47845 RepID=A0A2A3YFH4_9MICO|nr:MULTISPECIES: alanine racemase [Brachybacterium]PCC31681.1 alanine racemase [Brachybacterium alimentarium]PCC38047.1 alanine racemase [Brachybacterium alimentarium]RCS64537.1 alanine racemase [Brachybacterium sp. JB7]RCS65392.1 alanine racemase [Brachybacterium alimentarium]RCS74340.1 alanine racemase [Brachybacterium alimentarium]